MTFNNESIDIVMEESDPTQAAMPALKVVIETTTAPRRTFANSKAVLSAVPRSVVLSVATPVVNAVRNAKSVTIESARRQMGLSGSSSDGRQMQMIEPPMWNGRPCVVKGYGQDKPSLHVRPIPLRQCHLSLQGVPCLPGVNSVRILTASEWVDRVAPRSFYDPGWAGTAAMIAPEGAPSYELPWAQIQQGITLVIPSVLQLIDFQDNSLAELHAKFWTDRSHGELCALPRQ